MNFTFCHLSVYAAPLNSNTGKTADRSANYLTEKIIACALACATIILLLIMLGPIHKQCATETYVRVASQFHEKAVNVKLYFAEYEQDVSDPPESSIHYRFRDDWCIILDESLSFWRFRLHEAIVESSEEICIRVPLVTLQWMQLNRPINAISFCMHASQLLASFLLAYS